jgi:alpha/beta superfamily hydrolase
MVRGMTSTAAPSRPSISPASALLRSVDVAGPAGRLEALLNEGAPQAAFAALVCHPHPLGGGTMHNKVVYHAMKALNDPAWGLGWPVLRFNFRGTGLSDGTHHGEAETGDVLAALDWLENEYNLPTAVVGFSFGAAMALAACCGRPLVPALAALGLPTHAEGRDYRYPCLSSCTIPKLFLSGDRDQYAPAAQLDQVAAAAAEPKRLVLIPGADHFFTGRLEPMQQALAGWLLAGSLKAGSLKEHCK